jgi:hypothetical protein
MTRILARGRLASHAASTASADVPHPILEVADVAALSGAYNGPNSPDPLRLRSDHGHAQLDEMHRGTH